MSRNQEFTDLEVFRPFLKEDPKLFTNQTAQIRAEARLEQIMSTSRHPASVSAPARNAAPMRLRALRWAAIPAAAAAMLAAGALLPNSPGAPPAHASLASWSAHPTTLPANLLALADANCQVELYWASTVQAPPGSDGQGWTPATDIDESGAPAWAGQAVAAEQRGDWAMLGYLTADGRTGTCLSWLLAPGGPQAQTIFLGPLGPQQEAGMRASFFGSGRGDGNPSEVSSASLFAMESGAAQEAQLRGSRETFSSFVGPVSPDAVSVVVHTSAVGEVEATVAAGFFMAWWPGEMNFRDWSDFAVQGFTVTYADGSTEFVPSEARAWATMLPEEEDSGEIVDSEDADETSVITEDDEAPASADETASEDD